MNKPTTSVIPSSVIESKILLIRGRKVLLDRDLAGLYGVETRALNQAVQRNRKRFPPDFMLELTRDEIRNISQIVTCSTIKHSKNVCAFTQEGVAMLSSVLRSQRAIEVNIAIMRAFVRLRQILFSNKEFAEKLDRIERRTGRHDKEIHSLFEMIRRLMASPATGDRKIEG